VEKSSGFGLRNLLIFARSRKERGKPLTPDQVDLIEDWETANGRKFEARDEAKRDIRELPLVANLHQDIAQELQAVADKLKRKRYKTSAIIAGAVLFLLTLGPFWNLVKSTIIALAKVFVVFVTALLTWIGNLILSSPIPIAIFITSALAVTILVSLLKSRIKKAKRIAAEAEQHLREIQELKLKELLRL